LSAYYYCPHCRQGQSPRDRELDIVDTDYSPGVRRMMAVVGSETSFDRGRAQLELLAGLAVTRKAVERNAEAIGEDIAEREQANIQCALQLDLPAVAGPRIPVLYIEMDGTGVPVVNKETEGRKGKSAGEQAHTREVKLGAVFTQTTVDPEGRPVRDEASTSYTGAIEASEEFGRRLYTEAWDRGWGRAEIKVVLGDGAVWIWNIADREFPGAIQIVDLYHAREHLWGLAGKLFTNEKQRKRWAGRWQDKLDRERSKPSSGNSAPFRLRLRKLPQCFASRPTTLSAMPNGCVIPSSASRDCSSARASSRPPAKPSLPSG
jgi:hypothetical protein